MNKQLSGEHPSEEQLIESALTGLPPDLQAHVDNCPTCAQTVREFKEVGQRIASLDVEDVPVRLEQRIFSVARRGHMGNMLSGIQSIVSNPFLIALAVAVVVIVIYFLVGSEVFKAP